MSNELHIVVVIVKDAINRLYSLPLAELRVADPSMEDIAALCRLFVDLVQDSNIEQEFVDAIKVLGEAADAILSDDEKTVTDCAYHLEEIFGNISSR